MGKEIAFYSGKFITSSFFHVSLCAGALQVAPQVLVGVSSGLCRCCRARLHKGLEMGSGGHQQTPVREG